MLDYERNLRLAGAMAQTLTDAAVGMMETSASAWAAAPAAPEEGRSWYRAPQPNPFDLNTWVAAMPSAMNPMAAFNPFAMPFGSWGQAAAGPFTQPFAASFTSSLPFRPWSALAAIVNTMALFESSQNFWSPASAPAPKIADRDVTALIWQVAMLPIAHLDAVREGAAHVVVAQTVDAPSEYARHRSSGGHATVAITVMAEPTLPLPRVPPLAERH